MGSAMIPLMGRGFQAPDINEGRVSRARAQVAQAQARKLQQQIDDENELDSVLSQTGGELTPAILKNVMAVNPRIGAQLQQAFSRQQADQLKLKEAEQAQAVERRKRVAGLFGAVQDPRQRTVALMQGIKDGVLTPQEAGELEKQPWEEFVQQRDVLVQSVLDPTAQQSLRFGVTKEQRDAEAAKRAAAKDARDIREFEATLPGKVVNPLSGMTRAQVAQMQATQAGQVPTSVREYQTAVADKSFNGSFNEWLTQDANRKAPRTTVNVNAGQQENTAAVVGAIVENPELFNELPPTERVKLIPALKQAGFQFPEKAMSGEAAKVFSIATNVGQDLKALKDAIKASPRTAALGIITGLDTRLSRLKDNAADKIGRLRSGGAITESEESRFQGLIARAMDVATGDPGAAIEAIDSLIQEADVVAKRLRPNPPKGGGAGGTAGVPGVGSMFNGERVTNVRRVK